MERIMIQLETDTLKALDEAAGESGKSRSALAREAIENALAERRRRREIQQVVDSFSKRPQEKDLFVPREYLRKVWPE